MIFLIEHVRENAVFKNVQVKIVTSDLKNERCIKVKLS